MTNSFTASPNISFRHNSLKEKAAGQIICFRNCRLFRDGMFVQKAFQELWVRDGRVLEPIKIFYGERKRPNINVDCEGHILAPGFLDIQVNGAFGVDFTSLAETEPEEAKKQIKLVAEGILQYGVRFDH
jgi:N-acetylglucosamine-6-phosphate deacetylase